MYYKKRAEEQDIIKQETRTSMIIGGAILLSTIMYGLIAYFIPFRQLIKSETLDILWGIASIFVVLMMIIILALRKTIYYSPKIIQPNFTIQQVLEKWRTIDIIFLAAAETIPVCGLILCFLGIPFDKNMHFFVGAALLIIILMPMGIKVRSKLSILREHFPEI